MCSKGCLIVEIAVKMRFVSLVLITLCIASFDRIAARYDHYDDKIEAEIDARIAHNTPSIPSEWHDQLDAYQAIYQANNQATGVHHAHSNVGPGGIPAMYAYGGPMPHEHHRSPYEEFHLDEDGGLPTRHPYDPSVNQQAEHHVPDHAYHSHPTHHDTHTNQAMDDHHPPVPNWMARDEQRNDVYDKYAHLGSNTAADKLRAKKMREDKERQEM